MSAPGDGKAKREAARESVGTYHEACLAEIQDRVRVALARSQAGELDASDVRSASKRRSATHAAPQGAVG